MDAGDEENKQFRVFETNNSAKKKLREIFSKIICYY